MCLKEINGDLFSPLVSKSKVLLECGFISGEWLSVIPFLLVLPGWIALCTETVKRKHFDFLLIDLSVVALKWGSCFQVLLWLLYWRTRLAYTRSSWQVPIPVFHSGICIVHLGMFCINWLVLGIVWKEKMYAHLQPLLWSRKLLTHY